MAQNIYDNEKFFKGYKELERSIGGLESYIEWPTMRHLLEPVKGKDIVDLGSGFGFFCRWARDAGAESVRGLDISENKLSHARNLEKESEEKGTTGAKIEYARADMETLELEDEVFDIAFSSLAFHYLPNSAFDAVIREVYNSLRLGGRLVFSVEHPIYTAATSKEWVVHDKEGTKVTWPLDRYSDETSRTNEWLTDGVVTFHRTVSTYVGSLLRAGFQIPDLKEFGFPLDHPDAHRFWRMRHRPAYLVLAGIKRAE